MAARYTIVGLGEALFDIFPDRTVLGGAPLNVAFHAHQCMKDIDGQGVVVSRIGQDDLGDQLLAELRNKGMTTEYVQTDPDRSTGRVYIELSPTGQPEYEIVSEVAWEWLQFDPDIESLAGRCQAVCFGSLAQREGEARSAIYRFVTEARRAVKLFDVNLRQKFYNQSILRRSCELANALKLNEQELPIVAAELGIHLSQDEEGDAWAGKVIDRLRKKYDLKVVALTRGEQGTMLFTEDGNFETDQVSYELAEGADAVGAGDACSAGLLIGMVRRWPWERTVSLANHMGAYAASQPGATPTLPDSILEMVKS